MAAPASYSRRSYVGNAAATTVPLGLGAADGSCTIASATNWPSGSGGDFLVVIDRGSNTEELAWCSSTSGTTLTFALRGAQGTSGVSHSAGCPIALAFGQQDLDEANQVVSAVLGQASAAKGDILYMLSAAGPNTLQRLGVGNNGSVLSAASGVPAYSLAGTSGMLLQSAGSAVPIWLVPPGYLLATQSFAPASLSTYSVVASTTLTALDTTNATLALTVPASGNITVDCEADVFFDAGTSNSDLQVALLNHSGGAQIGKTVTLSNLTSAVTNAHLRWRFYLTGLTPGALQVDLAAAVSVTTGLVAAILYAQGFTATTQAKHSPLVMQAFAA